MKRFPSDGAWHYIGAAGEPGFVNSYANYGGAYIGARYRQDEDGLVTIGGLIANAFGFGGASGIFTMPAGFTPIGYGVSAGPIYLAIGAFGGTPSWVRLDVFGDGTVILNQATPGGTAVSYLSLDGIQYYAN